MIKLISVDMFGRSRENMDTNSSTLLVSSAPLFVGAEKVAKPIANAENPRKISPVSRKTCSRFNLDEYAPSCSIDEGLYVRFTTNFLNMLLF